MRFVTKIYHSNIDSKYGYIHLDELSVKWSPEMTILTALIALVALLLRPEPFKLQVTNDAALMYTKEFYEYRILAQRWT